jgi:hypothetical protein
MRLFSGLLYLLPAISVAAGAGACSGVCRCTGDTVDCSYLNLRAVPDALPASTKTLLLGGNKIRTITPNAFAGVSGLILLDLSDNLLDSLAFVGYQGLSRLQQLAIPGNRVAVLGRRTFALHKRLLALAIYDNPLGSKYIYTDALEGLVSLKSLQIDRSAQQLVLPALCYVSLACRVTFVPPGTSVYSTPAPAVAVAAPTPAGMRGNSSAALTDAAAVGVGASNTTTTTTTTAAAAAAAAAAQPAPPAPAPKRTFHYAAGKSAAPVTRSAEQLLRRGYTRGGYCRSLQVSCEGGEGEGRRAERQRERGHKSRVPRPPATH